MSEWTTYERKRYAFERKYKGRVETALNEQLDAFIHSYKLSASTNVDAHFHFGGILPLLHSIYKAVGADFAARTAKELRTQAKKANTPQMRLKFVRGLGFSEDWAKQIIERLQASGLSLAQKISQTTKSEVLAIMEEGAREGWSIDKIAYEIALRVKKINARRAQTIARTEVGRAANEGKMIGAKSLGVVVDKIWIGAADHRERPSHYRQNDQQIGFEDKFKNGLSYPGDPSAPANEVVNCRCTMTFKVKKDAQGKPIPTVYMEGGTMLLTVFEQ